MSSRGHYLCHATIPSTTQMKFVFLDKLRLELPREPNLDCVLLKSLPFVSPKCYEKSRFSWQVVCLFICFSSYMFSQSSLPFLSFKQELKSHPKHSLLSYPQIQLVIEFHNCFYWVSLTCVLSPPLNSFTSTHISIEPLPATCSQLSSSFLSSLSCLVDLYLDPSGTVQTFSALVLELIWTICSFLSASLPFIPHILLAHSLHLAFHSYLPVKFNSSTSSTVKTSLMSFHLSTLLTGCFILIYISANSKFTSNVEIIIV